MKINVGCGSYPTEGWHNIDLVDPSADEIGDVMEMRHSDVEEIALLHVLEHFPWQETDRVLKHLSSWLAPNGRMTVEVPDMETIMQMGTSYPLWVMYVYGAQVNEGEYHMAGFTLPTLREAVIKGGLRVESSRAFRSQEAQRAGYPCIEVVGRKLKFAKSEPARHGAIVYGIR